MTGLGLSTPTSHLYATVETDSGPIHLLGSSGNKVVGYRTQMSLLPSPLAYRPIMH